MKIVICNAWKISLGHFVTISEVRKELDDCRYWIYRFDEDMSCWGLKKVEDVARDIIDALSDGDEIEISCLPLCDSYVSYLDGYFGRLAIPVKQNIFQKLSIEQLRELKDSIEDTLRESRKSIKIYYQT